MLQKVRLLRLHKGVPLAVQQQRGRRNGRQCLLEVRQTEVVARRKVLLKAADKVDVLAPQAAHPFPVTAVGSQVELQLRGAPVGEVLRPEDVPPGDGPAATGDGALQDERAEAVVLLLVVVAGVVSIGRHLQRGEKVGDEEGDLGAVRPADDGVAPIAEVLESNKIRPKRCFRK